MNLSKSQLQEIKEVAQGFIKDNAFKKSEDDVQSSYTLEILRILGWKPNLWQINKTTDVKTQQRPDIMLKGNSGTTIFIIESKEPQVENGLDGRYKKWTFTEQICAYCNTEGVSWGLLTNFKEWQIYNPHSYKSNGTSYREIKLITNDNTICNDNEINQFFSLIDNSFLNSCRGKISKEKVYYPKKEDIKDEFFQNLKEWRKDLRNFLYSKYKSLSPEEIDCQTQKILDRLIFMDFCYDKEIITNDYLGAVLNTKQNIYNELKRIFEQFNEQFNSDVFRTDECDNFDITNDVSEKIIDGIRKIDYSQLDVHIIGEVYENYLGELLRAGKKNITTTESKEHLKRKSQGIYYTPDYIVNYIVDNTLGELLKKCETEKDIEKIKVIDISCGSGSFLIGAFDILYEAYKNMRNKETLTIPEELTIRKKILLHNLFGVDLDERAVEIAKLNLLLRALEGLQEIKLTSKKILPNLSLNIRCGNSLISGSSDEDNENYESNRQLSFLFDKSSEYKEDIKKLIELKEIFYKEEDNEIKNEIINKVHIYEEKINKYINQPLKNYFKNFEEIKPFNYEVSFCEIFKNGGFDVVIGNPPFVQLSMEKDFTSAMKSFLLNSYGSTMGRFNTFGFFIQRSIEIIKTNGFSGLIIPNTILTQESYQVLRKYILQNTSIKEIVNYDKMPFKDAVVENINLILEKKKSEKNTLKIIDYINEYVVENELKQTEYKNTYQNQFVIVGKKSLSNKSKILKNKHILLGDICNINQAIALKYDRSQYLFNSKKTNNYFPVLDGKNIDKYRINWDGTYLKYDINAIHSCKKTDIFTCKEKLFFRRVSANLIATYDNKKYFALNTIVAITFIDKNTKYSLKYILGIFNSKLLNYYYTNYLKSTKKVFSEIQARQIEQLPINTINFENKEDKQQHDKIVKLVNEMIELNKNPEKNKNKINATDSEINDLVYKIYGLNKSEINLIEESFK